jgi:uncharacterized membrane protein HdeD (DUF308 family)
MEQYLNDLATYAQANPAIAGAVGLVLLYLLIRKTKLLLYFIVLAAVLGGVFYVIGEMSTKGGATKQKTVERIDKQDVK